MSARKLAVELAALEKSQRTQLLAELPAAKRAEMTRLVDELRSLVATPSDFEVLMAELETQSVRNSGAFQDERRLAQLLRSESIAVKKQILDVFVGGQKNLVAAHVRTLVAGYLEEQASRQPYLPPTPARRKTRWRFWR